MTNKGQPSKPRSCWCCDVLKRKVAELEVARRETMLELNQQWRDHTDVLLEEARVQELKKWHKVIKYYWCHWYRKPAMEVLGKINAEMEDAIQEIDDKEGVARVEVLERELAECQEKLAIKRGTAQAHEFLRLHKQIKGLKGALNLAHSELAECRKERDMLAMAVTDLQAEEKFLRREWAAAEAQAKERERIEAVIKHEYFIEPMSWEFVRDTLLEKIRGADECQS